jgi:hypothetical protein
MNFAAFQISGAHITAQCMQTTENITQTEMPLFRNKGLKEGEGEIE